MQSTVHVGSSSRQQRSSHQARCNVLWVELRGGAAGTKACRDVRAAGFGVRETCLCQSRDVSPYLQRNDLAPSGARAVSTLVFALCCRVRGRGVVVPFSVLESRDSVNQIIYRTIRHSATRTGPRPGAALGGRGSRRAVPRDRPAVVRVVRAAAAVYDKVISSLNVVVAGSRGWFSLASFILRSLVFRHIAASGPGASASKI